MGNQLTNREFWTNYWESKSNLDIEINKDYLFHDQFEDIASKVNIKSAIELGGFPGYYTIFLKKYLKLEATLLDYFVHQDILKNVLEKNNLTEQDINIIEADLFSYVPEKQYDLVFSCGLIEHFADTKDIISRHIQFLKPGGILFITLPNFKSVNGWIQKKLDKENYLKHNIDCMDPKLLALIASNLGLKEVKAGYLGQFSVWLEDKKHKSIPAKALFRLVWITGKILVKFFRVKSKKIYPYIVLTGKK